MQKTLSEWLCWLESLHPKEIELGLDRINQVAERLCIFSRLTASQSKVITVAGTNGKGSCVATMEAITLATNYSVGSYTSPHFLKFNERIRINGSMVRDDQLIRAFTAIEDARGNISLTYFEYTTLAGLWLFCEAELDYWLLEVGLGGRLDAVNIIDADVAVITSIALDHQDWLGDNREDIAREKAGIMRQGKPAICVDLNPPKSITECARDTGAKLTLIGPSFNWAEDNNRWRCQLLKSDEKNATAVRYTDLVTPGLPLPSVVGGLQALLHTGALIDRDLLNRVLSDLQLTGRNQQRWFSGKRLILDVAHNPAAATLLAKRIGSLSGKVAAVFAVMGDKDVAGIVEPLSKCIDHWYVADLVDNPRAAKAVVLAELIEEGGKPVVCCDTVQAAIESALLNSNDGDTVVVFGSFYTVADALSVIDDSAVITGESNG